MRLDIMGPELKDSRYSWTCFILRSEDYYRNPGRMDFETLPHDTLNLYKY